MTLSSSADILSVCSGELPMSDKDSIVKKIEKEIGDAAKKIEDFADKVAAPEEPLVILPNDEDEKPERPKKS